jgi:hypothetical protein
MLLVDVIINVSWYHIAGMDVTYVSVDKYRPSHDYNVCLGRSEEKNFAYVSLAYKFVCILGGVLCAVYARNAPAQFNETSSIFTSIYSTMLICILSVPFVALQIGSREANYVIQSVGILLLVSSLVSFIFIPKIYYIRANSSSFYSTVDKKTMIGTKYMGNYTINEGSLEGGNLDGRSLGGSLEGGNFGGSLEGGNLGGSLDGRSLGGRSLNGRSLGDGHLGVNIGGIMKDVGNLSNASDKVKNKLFITTAGVNAGYSVESINTLHTPNLDEDSVGVA